MFAVIKTGGKQYKVAEGQKLRVEKLDAEEGSEITLSDVLMVAGDDQVQIGSPYVEGGAVTATVEAHGRAKKVEIVKFRRRKHHRKQQGHRQHFTELKITGISAG